ncbi:MAG: flagellar assembly protein FliW [Ignavibacteria bacterium]|nr:flagellar assembly protein FliW [Ignavibacteria bacterium]
MTANMKAPILLGVERQTGEQIILPGDNYSTIIAFDKAPLPRKMCLLLIMYERFSQLNLAVLK